MSPLEACGTTGFQLKTAAGRNTIADHSPTGSSSQEEESLGKAYDARLMRRLLTYLRPYRLQVAAAILMLVFSSGLELIGPWLTRVAIDRAFPQADYSFLSLLGLLFLGSLALSALLGYMETILTAWIGQR
ncbi:MAG: ABC transporter ATP-binding protein, partial [Gemmatimonadales bacterium]